MTIASAAILLLIAVPLLVLIVDVVRLSAGRAEVTPPALEPTRAVPVPGAAAVPRSAGIRPGEGMVYRGPAVGARR